MTIIGITGGTGGGKTTALNALKKLDALIIDADQVYHDLTVNSPELRRDLEERYGQVYGEDGRLDRKKLGNIVFQDPEALQDLNRITHRHVSDEVDRLLGEAKEKGTAVAAIDAIELIESGLGDKCDHLVAIIAPVDLRVKRIMARENISEEYARMRIMAQKSDDYFRDHCDYILESDERDTVETFGVRALELFQKLLAQ